MKFIIIFSIIWKYLSFAGRLYSKSNRKVRNTLFIDPIFRTDRIGILHFNP